jgi:hypothetical protein
VHVLTLHTEANDARWNSLQRWNPIKQPDGQRWFW